MNPVFSTAIKDQPQKETILGPESKPLKAASRSPEHILHLQRAAGNHAVGQSLRPRSRFPIQPKLTLSQPGDPYEQEADRVAENVITDMRPQHGRKPAKESSPHAQIHPFIQRQSDEERQNSYTAKGETAESVLLIADEEETHVSTKRSIGNTPKVTPDIEGRLSASRERGTALPVNSRRFFESRFGTNFSSVRVHVDNEAAQLSQQLNARAFTQGNDIYFAQNQYSVDSMVGKRLLAHELTHVVQQGNTHTSAPIQRQEKNEGQAQSDARYDFKIPVKKVVSEEEFVIISLMHIFQIDRGQAIELKAEHKWRFHDHSGIDNVDVRKGFRIVSVKQSSYRSTLDRLKGRSEGEREQGGRIKGAKGREDTFQGLAKEERAKINKEADRQFQKTTGSNRATDRSQAEQWKDLRDEILADKAKLEALPDNIKALITADGKKALEPKDYQKLLHIASKLKQLKPEDIELYRLIAKQISQDLDAFEKSIDTFAEFRDEYRRQFEEATKSKPAEGDKKEPTLEEQLAKTYEGLDEKKFGTLNTDQKEALARDIAAKQRNIQLEYMAKHPGKTAAGMVEGVVRVDQVAKGIYEDVKEAANGDKSAFARWAGGVGAGSKLSGWIAGAAGIAYVALLFIPGVNVAALATTALVAGVAALTLSAVESELRIKAAGEAKDTGEFKTQTEKAAAAQANAIVGAALLAVGLAVKLIARIPLPGRLQSVGNAFKLARNALVEKTGAGPAFRSIKANLLERLRAAREGLAETLGQEAKGLSALTKRIEKMTGDQLLERLAAGDKELQDLTKLSPGDAKQLQEIAKTPAGKDVANNLRQSILKALEDAPVEASKQLNKFLNDVQESINSVEKAESAEQLKAAIDNAEKHFSTEEVTKQATAQQETYIKERLQAEKYKGLSDQDLKSASLKDPSAYDELIRRYESKKIAELEKLAKEGDGTAAYVLGNKRTAGYRQPAEVPLRPSNLTVLDRLKARLAKLRGSSGIPKEGSTGGTFGVAETDLPLKTQTFEGGSPKTGSQPDPTYKPPTEFGSAQGHAEQNLVGALKKAISDAKLDIGQLKDKTVYMLIEQEVCATCKAGLYNDSAGAGVLKQFSREFPDLTIEVMNLETGEVLRIRGGQLVK